MQCIFLKQQTNIIIDVQHSYLLPLLTFSVAYRYSFDTLELTNKVASPERLVKLGLDCIFHQYKI